MSHLLRFLLCLLLLVPNLSWAAEPQQVIASMQSFADSPWGKLGKKVAIAALTQKVCDQAFTLETEKLLGTGKLCRNTFTGERYFSLSLLGCHLIQKREGNITSTQAVLVFPENAQARFLAMVNAGITDLKVVPNQGCGISITLPQENTFSTVLYLVQAIHEL